MIKAMRYFLILVSIFQIFGAVAFFFQWSVVVQFWPFEGTTPLTYILVSSIFAAAAAATLWAALTENYGTLAGIALDYITIMAPASVLLFQIGARSSNPTITIEAIIFAGGAIFGLALFLWSVRIPIRSSQPMPGLVKGSFIFFVIALLLVGGRLILNVPNSFPWNLTLELSTVVGWMFVGAATYFVYALLRPSWLNSTGQMLGFLAYDVVLIVPFLNRLTNTPPDQRLAMIIYTLVVLFSGLLAIYYLFLNSSTRLWKPNPIPAP